MNSRPKTAGLATLGSLQAACGMLLLSAAILTLIGFPVVLLLESCNPAASARFWKGLP